MLHHILMLLSLTACLIFVQERAPTSVAYAENQSMFLDSLSGDAAWLGRYAVSRDGQVIPWSVVEQLITDTHPYEVFAVSRVTVPAAAPAKPSCTPPACQGCF